MHPYRTVSTKVTEPRAEGDGRIGALGVLTAVSVVQVVTAFHHAGTLAVPTVIGAAGVVAGVLGLSNLGETARRADRARAPRDAVS